jgi:hypothetical protein
MEKEISRFSQKPLSFSFPLHQFLASIYWRDFCSHEELKMCGWGAYRCGHLLLPRAYRCGHLLLESHFTAQLPQEHHITTLEHRIAAPIAREHCITARHGMSQPTPDSRGSAHLRRTWSSSSSPSPLISVRMHAAILCSGCGEHS